MRVKAAIERRVLQTFLDNPRGHAIECDETFVLIAPTHVPLAAHEGLIACRLESLRHQMLAQIGATCVVRGMTDRIAAREQGRTCHRAHRGAVEAFQADRTRPRGAETVHRRRLNRHLARWRVIAHIAPALVIRDDDDHVWRGHGGDGERKSLRGATIGRIGHFDGEVEVSGLSRCAAQNTAGAQRDAIRQRTAEKAPNIARAASAGGGQGLAISTRRAAIWQRRRRGDRRSRSDGVARRRRCRRAAATAAHRRNGEVHRGSIRLRRNCAAPDAVIRRAITMQTVVIHRHHRRRRTARRIHHDVVHIETRRTRRRGGAVAGELPADLCVRAEFRACEAVAIGLRRAVRLRRVAVVQGGGRESDGSRGAVEERRRVDGESGAVGIH